MLANKTKTTTALKALTVRISTEVDAELERRIAGTDRTKQGVVEEALKFYFAKSKAA